MPRLYAITVAAVSVSAAQDLFSLQAADDHPIEIVGIDLGQTSSTTQENIGVSIIRGHTSVGSGGTSATPVPADPGDAAASFTARINDTTVASAGSAVTLLTSAWNLLAGYAQWWHDPETRPQAGQASLLVVRLTAPAAARTVRATLWVLER